jgi:nucleotide-binding universal stress UspA family protein
MPRILVPVDGSDSSHRALSFAIDRARREPGTEIHALYVHPPIDVGGKIQIYVTPERMRELATEQSERIFDGIRRQLESNPAAHTLEMLEGDPAHTIAQRAQELGCDSIVMGTRGMGRISGLLMGSITTKVIHLSPLPVTLVK